MVNKVIETEPKWSDLIAKEVDSRFNEINVDIDFVQNSVNETRRKSWITETNL